jgi:hypothetical protein
MNRSLWISFALAMALGACKSATSTPQPPTQPEQPDARKTAPIGGNLDRFTSDAELKSYIDALVAERKKDEKEARARAMSNSAGQPAPTASPAAPPAAEAESADASKEAKASDSITNTQEANVDEGGIVKTHGDHLVVLRRGRLFTVRVGDGAPRPVSTIDVFAPGTTPDAWYDEMLIHGNTIVVVGYSYRAEATELGLFDIDAQGGLKHRGTHFLRSNDYYSSRNYASRLLGDKLVFYMPHALLNQSWANDETNFVPSFPAVRAATGQWRDVVRATQVFRPIQKARFPVLHTVVTCDLARRDLDCSARAVLGPWGRTFYVSSRAVYVWVTDEVFGPLDDAKDVRRTGAVVYRLPLDGGVPGAVRVRGAPTDQFSFKEARDRLHVLVRGDGDGDGMFAPEARGGGVALATVKLDNFASHEAIATDRSEYVDLPRPEGWSMQNRFVGDVVLYGTGIGWNHPQPQTGRLFMHRVSGDRESRQLRLPHGVDRIEPMGDDAVIVGSDGKDLHFSAVQLAGTPRIVDRYVERNAMQGETRSHGFFFKPTADEDGLLGLPVRGGDEPGFSQLVHGSASVLFLKVTDLRFSALGGLRSRNDGRDDKCVASCVDWYGNARPIFWKNRIFALLGYELVEGRIDDNEIMETARVNFSPAGRVLRTAH